METNEKPSSNPSSIFYIIGGGAPGKKNTQVVYLTSGWTVMLSVLFGGAILAVVLIYIVPGWKEGAQAWWDTNALGKKADEETPPDALTSSTIPPR
jgi:hypothetical protein